MNNSAIIPLFPDSHSTESPTVTPPVTQAPAQAATVVVESREPRMMAKVKQVKTTVTKRVVRNRKNGSESICWDVKVGSAVVQVYFTPSGERKFYTVSYWLDGKRKRQVLPTFDGAVEAAKDAGKKLNEPDKNKAGFTVAQLAMCRRAMEFAAPTTVPLDVIAQKYAEIINLLQGSADPVDAIKEFVKRNPPDIGHTSVADVITKCLEAKRQDQLSDRYINQLEYDLNRFETKFPGNIGKVSGAEINSWLRAMQVSPRTRNNIRMSIQTLFSFAKTKRFVAKVHDEMDAVPVAKELGGAIEIFTPSELEELLAHAATGMKEIIPFLTIGAFAGIRHAEIQRLDWKDVRFEDGIIEIRAAKAKTASRRTVPILPNLRAWLEGCKKESGPVCAYSNVVDRIVSLIAKVNKAREKERAKAEKKQRRKQAEPVAAPAPAPAAEAGAANVEKAQQQEEDNWKFKWKHNGLRHSFISYRVAQTQNVAQVALEAGNSPQIIFSNYRELVTPKDTEAWFGIVPEK